ILLDDHLDEQNDESISRGLKDPFVIPLRMTSLDLAGKTIVFPQEERVHHRDLGSRVRPISSKREDPGVKLRIGEVVQPQWLVETEELRFRLVGFLIKKRGVLLASDDLRLQPAPGAQSFALEAQGVCLFGCAPVER